MRFRLQLRDVDFGWMLDQPGSRTRMRMGVIRALQRGCVSSPVVSLALLKAQKISLATELEIGSNLS